VNVFALNTATILALIVSVVIPLIAALLSKARWPQEVTGIITAALATANGFFTEWANSTGANHYNWQAALGIAIGSFFLAIAAHYGVWKDTATTAKLLNFPVSKAATTTPPVDGHAA